MVPLSRAQSTALKSWFLPDQPGMLLGLHALQTDQGRFYADQWPEPKVVLVAQRDNYALAGDPRFLSPRELRGIVSGVIDAPRSFLPLLQAAFPDLYVWDRVAFALQGEPALVCPTSLLVRRLTAADGEALASLSEELSWIHNTWGGTGGLARSSFAWAAFSGRRIISVACSFFVGEHYEEIGIVTETEYRRRGLAAACAHALCREIIARGRQPSWSTGVENEASIRLAKKLGFHFERYDHLYVANWSVPKKLGNGF